MDYLQKEIDEIIEKCKQNENKIINFKDYEIQYFYSNMYNRYIFLCGKKNLYKSTYTNENEIKDYLYNKLDNSQKYFVQHYSTMSGTSVYFIANNKQLLLDNKNLFDKYLDTNYQNENIKIWLEIKKKNIKICCNESCDFDENVINNAICVAIYGYRF